ncbi:MAG TPA: ribose-phosphate pyrophosphokinase [Acidobacteriota bacterium]|nr:ribose-phosphate pyrophosphokinase [Acidobacteriota bacterium]
MSTSPYSSSESELKVFSGNANVPLAQEICRKLKIPLGRITLTTFSDGELYCQILENVRGRDIFVIQPTCCPVNDNMMELLIMIDAFKRSSASRITAVMPYYGYARQDRKDKPRVPISSKLVADLLTAAGADRILTMDLHAGQIQGFFNIPVDHLFASPVLIRYLQKLRMRDLTLVSPDAGGVERARAFAKRLNGELAVVDKRRVGPNEAEVMHVIGQVGGRNVIICDDMIDTAGTLVNTVHALRKKKAKRILACATHGVLSGPAIERLKKAELDEIILTNTVPVEKSKVLPGMVFLSVAGLLAEAIRSIHEETSVSNLFV